MSRFILTALSFLLAALFPADGPAGMDTSSLLPEEQKVLYEAQEAIQTKDIQTAVRLLTAHLREHPNKPNPLLFFALGNAWYMDGNLKKASQIYGKGHAMHPGSFLLCTNFAAVSYETGNYLKAGKLFEKAYRLGNPPDSEHLWQAGTAYYKANALKKAKSVLKRMRRPKGGMKKSRLQLLTQVCLDMKDWKEAESVVLELLNLAPNDVEYWKLLSHIRLQRDNYRGAAGTLEILFKIRPPVKKELEDLANLFFYLNFPLKGARCLEKAYGPAPSPRQCDKISKAFIQAQRPDKALHYLDLAIRQERLYARVLEKGKLYYSRGRWDDAASVLRECVRTWPDRGFAHLLLGYCAMEKEDFTLARTSFLNASKEKEYRDKALSALRLLEAVSL